MNTIKIQEKLVGFPIDLEISTDEPTAGLLDFSFSDFPLPWYRFRETSGKIHDGGLSVEETSEEVVDNTTFETWLITNLNLTKIEE